MTDTPTIRTVSKPDIGNNTLKSRPICVELGNSFCSIIGTYHLKSFIGQSYFQKCLKALVIFDQKQNWGVCRI